MGIVFSSKSLRPFFAWADKRIADELDTDNNVLCEIYAFMRSFIVWWTLESNGDQVSWT